MIDLQRRRVILLKAQKVIERSLRDLDHEEMFIHAQEEFLRRQAEPPVVNWRRSPRYRDGVPVVDLTFSFADQE